MKQPTSRPRILVFSLAYFPFIGGAEVALHEIIRRLPQLDFDLITARFDKNLPLQEKNGNLTVYRLGQGSKLDKYLYPWRAFLLAKKLHQQNNYNLIWAMLATWAGLPALFFKLKFSQVKYLLTLQSGDSDWFIWLRTWFWQPVYRMIYSRADHIQVISQWLAQRARRYGYQGEISLIPNGVEIGKYQLSVVDSQLLAIKNKLNIKESDKIVFSSSRLVKKNDLSSLIKAVKILITDYHLSVKLIIAGAGKLENRLKKLTQQLKLQDKVIFLGQLKPAELLPYYALADVFARPSLSEGQGISFIEAMAAGLPVVATPVGGIPDFIFDQQTGIFCQPKNPHSIAEKINLLFENRELYLTVKNKAFKLVQENYSWAEIVLKMDKLFKQLIQVE